MKKFEKIKFVNSQNSLGWFHYLPEIEALIFVKKDGFYKNCIVLFIGSYVHPLAIDNALYEETFHSLEEYFEIDLDKEKLLSIEADCIVLYKRHKSKDYSILQEINELNQGIIIEKESTPIDWSISYNDLKEISHVFERYSIHQNKYLQIGNCQIFGINLPYLEVALNKQNKNSPIEKFTSKIYGDGSSKVYHRVKERLLNIGGEIKDCYEDDERYNNCLISLDGIEIRIMYPSRRTECYVSDNLSFIVTNKREYPDLLDLKDYESSIHIDNEINLPEQVHISHNYRKSEFVKNTPRAIKILNRSNPIAWIDRKNGIFGVTDFSFSNCFEIEKIISFFIQNTAPAKGPGWSQLGLVHKDYGEVGILSSHFKHLDFLEKELNEKLDREVDYRKIWHDC